MTDSGQVMEGVGRDEGGHSGERTRQHPRCEHRMHHEVGLTRTRPVVAPIAAAHAYAVRKPRWFRGNSHLARHGVSWQGQELRRSPLEVTKVRLHSQPPGRRRSTLHACLCRSIHAKTQGLGLRHALIACRRLRTPQVSRPTQMSYVTFNARYVCIRLFVCICESQATVFAPHQTPEHPWHLHLVRVNATPFWPHARPGDACCVIAPPVATHNDVGR
mmetsp:Transcript_6914/g.17216  ORF Transcript_6914/g.17216 Transcript_6914/m.17216 type:complete len:217 (-) Transcript_6914:1168-1818(-)